MKLVELKKLFVCGAVRDVVLIYREDLITGDGFRVSVQMANSVEPEILETRRGSERVFSTADAALRVLCEAGFRSAQVVWGVGEKGRYRD